MDFHLPGLDTKTLSEEGVDMPVKTLKGDTLKDKDGKPVTLKVLGPDSAKYRALTRAQIRKRIQRSSVPGAAGEATFEEDEADALGILVACTVGWSGINGKDGQPVPFSADACRTLYTNFPAIRDQVDVFVTQRVNFTMAS